MWSYILRRVLYSIPILICVNILTFILFFYVNGTDDIAASVLAVKSNNPANVYIWKRERNYHLPLFFNTRDTVYYISDTNRLPAYIKEGLPDYTIRLCNLSPETVAEEVERLKGDEDIPNRLSEKKEFTEQDGLASLIRRIYDDMKGNEVILLDWSGITAEQAGVVSGLLEAGVPFIVLHQTEETKNIPFEAVVQYQALRPENPEKSITELKEYIDAQQARGVEWFSQTVFFQKSVRLFWFDFGQSDREKTDISYQVVSRMGASMMITVPVFILGLFVNIFISMIVAYCRGTYIDRMVAVVCIVNMSILSLFYYFSAQLIFGVWLKIFPVSGFADGFSGIRFVMLPIIVSVLIGLGGGVRFYRTIFLEEVNRDYVRTGRSKGLSELSVLFKHVLKNAMIPILTNVVLVIPMLFIGSLILENFFGIPGLGGYTLEGIQAQDFRVVGAMVYLGSFLYVVGLLLTDISYTLVDPRVRFD